MNFDAACPFDLGTLYQETAMAKRERAKAQRQQCTISKGAAMLSCGKQSDFEVHSNDRSSSNTKLSPGFPLVQFLIWEMVGVLIAGIAVPTIFWSHAATGHSLVAGSLRHLVLGGISFRCTYQDIEFAILGAVVGTVGAWAMYVPGKFTGKSRVAHTLPQRHWKRFLLFRRHWRAGVSKAA
jgi:hypothetical protein